MAGGQAKREDSHTCHNWMTPLLGGGGGGSTCYSKLSLFSSDCWEETYFDHYILYRDEDERVRERKGIPLPWKRSLKKANLPLEDMQWLLER